MRLAWADVADWIRPGELVRRAKGRERKSGEGAEEVFASGWLASLFRFLALLQSRFGGRPQREPTGGAIHGGI